MKTTFIAIHLKDGKELTAEFKVFESHHQIVRLAADAAMEKAHGIRKAHGWSLVPIQTAECPWLSLAESRELGIPLPKAA